MVSVNGNAPTGKILAGERISTDDALELYGWPLEELGVLANARRDLAKEPAYGGYGREIVTYIVDRNINYTNVCNVYCKFCAFYRTEREEDHYVLSFEQIDQKLDELSAAGGVQILMQGGYFFFFKQKTAYEIGLGIPAEPLFRSLSLSKHLAHNLGNLLLLGKIGVFHNRRNASSRLLLLISKHLILCIYLVFRILA